MNSNTQPPCKFANNCGGLISSYAISLGVIMSKCPVCSFPTKYLTQDDRMIYNVHCYRCGRYRITDEAAYFVSKNYDNIKHASNLSSWLRENQGILLYERDVRKLKELYTPSVEEKAEKLILHFVKHYPKPGEVIPDILSQIDPILSQKDSANVVESTKIAESRIEFVLSSFAVSWCVDTREFGYLLLDYLWEYKKVLAGRLPNKITPVGWNYIHSLQERNLESNIAFIAMKFDDELKEFSEKYVEQGIYEAGYQPLRIDKHQHNNLIDDEIISNIKRSRFIIADFTFNNNGVYYEAGFARGLNIPVISICEKRQFEDEKQKVHFDTNHYSFILYEKDKGEELKKNITLRIEATIGKGSFRKEMA